MQDELPQLIRLTRESADRFNEELQIIMLEVELLSSHTDPNTLDRRLRTIQEAAHRAVKLSRQLFGLNSGDCTG